MSDGAAKRTEGWGSIDGSSKAHFFRNYKSLCGRWLALGSPHWESFQELGEKADEGTCAGCWKKRKKEESIGGAA